MRPHGELRNGSLCVHVACIKRAASRTIGCTVHRADYSELLKHGLFIERSLFVVDKGTLDAKESGADVLRALGADGELRVDRDDGLIRQEGSRHTIKLKGNGAFADLNTAQSEFARVQCAVQEGADVVGVRLLGTGMHPWMMPPKVNFERWGRDYQADNGHALRLSLPFETDDHFARLFAALRLIAPVLPALAASSPFVEGEPNGAKSCRLARRGDVLRRQWSRDDGLIPPMVPSREAYLATVVEPLRRALVARSLDNQLAPLDVCAHAVQADFGAGEAPGTLRVEMLDMQECLAADLAVVAALLSAVSAGLEERALSFERQKDWEAPRLNELARDVVLYGDEAILRDVPYIQALGFPDGSTCRARDLWQFVAEDYVAKDETNALFLPALTHIIRKGCLATRLLGAVRSKRDQARGAYNEVATCLLEDRLFA